MTSPPSVTGPDMIDLTTSDHVRLAAYRWLIDGSTATVVLVHGYGEHLGRYSHVAAHLNGRGFSVVGIDFRGHGRSDGPRGVVRRFSDYHRDLDCVVEHVNATCAGQFVGLLAHSMGGLVTCDWLLQHDPSAPRSIILSSPYLGLKIPPSWLRHRIVELLSTCAPTLPLSNPLRSHDLCRDSELVQVHREDPRVIRHVTPRWFCESVRAIDHVMQHAGDLRGQFLVLYGSGDRVANPAATALFVKRLGDKSEAELLPGYYHEILNEPPERRTPLLERISDWFRSRAIAD